MRLSCPPVPLLAALLVLLASTTVHAAGPKVIGSATFAGYPELAGVPIVDFQWAIRNAPSPGVGGGGSSKTTFDDFRITKLLDATAPVLLELTAAATHLTEVRVDLLVRRGTTASYVLSDVSIAVNDRHLSESGGVVLQDLALKAKTVRETLVTPGGTVTTCYNVATSKACD